MAKFKVKKLFFLTVFRFYELLPDFSISVNIGFQRPLFGAFGYHNFGKTVFGGFHNFWKVSCFCEVFWGNSEF